jgi:hypothetical protein
VEERVALEICSRSIVANTYNPSTWEVKAGRSRVQGLVGTQQDPVSKEKKIGIQIHEPEYTLHYSFNEELLIQSSLC